jgi:hypothetical protein
LTSNLFPGDAVQVIVDAGKNHVRHGRRSAEAVRHNLQARR